MTPPAIHPGEHLAEELKELEMSAAALSRSWFQKHNGNPQSPAGNNR